MSQSRPCTRKMAALAIAAILVATGSSGCAGIVSYEPDRQVIDSIPPELARSELRQLLGQAEEYVDWVRSSPFDRGRPRYRPVQVVSIDEDGFTLAGEDGDERSYRFAEIEPSVVYWEGDEPYEDKLFLRLVDSSTNAFAFKMDLNGGDIIAFDRPGEKEQVEKTLDALASLKAAARGR